MSSSNHTSVRLFNKITSSKNSILLTKSVKRKFYLILILFTPILIFPLNLILPPSANHNAASEINLLTKQPANSYLNPSLGINGIETSISYLYQTKDLAFYNLHLNKSWNYLRFYCGNQFLGNSLYKENITNLSIGYDLFEKLSIGLGIRNVFNKIKNYSESNSLLLDFGMNWSSFPIKTAFSFRNITNSKIDEIDLGMHYIWETSYKINENGILALQIEKESNEDFIYKIGSSYRLFQKFLILSSYQYRPARIGIGTEITLSKAKFSYSVRTHRFLDLTHFIGVGYEL